MTLTSTPSEQVAEGNRQMMEVKTLEWVCDGSKVMPSWKAEVAGIWYLIEEQSNGSLGKFWLTVGLRQSELFRLPSLEAAKDAAQAEHEALVSTLSGFRQGKEPGRAMVLREAAIAIAEEARNQSTGCNPYWVAQSIADQIRLLDPSDEDAVKPAVAGEGGLRAEFERWAVQDSVNLTPLGDEEFSDENGHYYEDDWANACFIGWREARRVALSTSVPAGVVKIKPLEWKPGSSESFVWESAATPFGHYMAYADEWYLVSNRQIGAKAKGIDGAKAAAQVDFDTRIRAAITPPAQELTR